MKDTNTKNTVNESKLEALTIDIEKLRHQQTKVQNAEELQNTVTLLNSKYDIEKASKKVFWGLKIRYNSKTIVEYYAKQIMIRIVLKSNQFDLLSEESKKLLRNRTVFKKEQKDSKIELEIDNEYVLSEEEALAIIDELIEAHKKQEADTREKKQASKKEASKKAGK